MSMQMGTAAWDCTFVASETQTWAVVWVSQPCYEHSYVTTRKYVWTVSSFCSKFPSVCSNALFVCLTELDNKATLSDHILTAVLGLLKKEVPEHGRHLQQYFHFFLMYSMIGPPEVCILISVQLTWPSRSSQSLLNRCIGLKGNWSFRYKSFPYELKQWNCTKIWITSSKVCNWTRKTFWVNILRSLTQRISLYRNDFVSKRPVTV